MDLSELDREIGEVYARRGWRMVTSPTIAPLSDDSARRAVQILDTQTRMAFQALRRATMQSATAQVTSRTLTRLDGLIDFLGGKRKVLFDG